MPDSSRIHEQQTFSKKVCKIAGAAGIIGETVAERLSSEGAVVAGTDRRKHAVGDINLVADLSVEQEV